MPTTYTISELAREFQVTPRTLRFYEDQGMLAPMRNGQRRIYRNRDRIRLKLILRGRRLGFPLAQIREMVDLYDAPIDGEARQLELLIGRIETRRRDLLQKREDINLTLGELEAVAAGCHERLEELVEPASATGSKAVGRWQ